jgi:hypothetical protein
MFSFFAAKNEPCSINLEIVSTPADGSTVLYLISTIISRCRCLIINQDRWSSVNVQRGSALFSHNTARCWYFHQPALEQFLFYISQLVDYISNPSKLVAYTVACSLWFVARDKIYEAERTELVICRILTTQSASSVLMLLKRWNRLLLLSW